MQPGFWPGVFGLFYWHGDLKNFGVFAFVASLQKQGMRIIVKNENEILTIKQKSKFKSFIFS